MKHLLAQRGTRQLTITINDKVAIAKKTDRTDDLELNDLDDINHNSNDTHTQYTLRRIKTGLLFVRSHSLPLSLGLSQPLAFNQQSIRCAYHVFFPFSFRRTNASANTHTRTQFSDSYIRIFASGTQFRTS